MRRLASLAAAATAAAAALWLLLPPAATAAPAELAEPYRSEALQDLNWGIFCALREMDRIDAPGTIAGWMHVPREEIRFDWPGERIVPAVPGLAFGVRMVLGADQPEGMLYQQRIYRPGRAEPETWESIATPGLSSDAYFRFDTEDELIPGIWAFEIVKDSAPLYRVEFEVVPAGARPGIGDSCGALS